MTEWSIGVNGYFGSAHIHRETAPWWSYLYEWWLDWFYLWLIPDIKLPAFILRRAVTDEGEKYLWSDWYGDTLRDRFSCYACGKISDLIGKRQHESIEVPFKEVIRSFGHLPEYAWFREQWDEGTEQWRENGPPLKDRGVVIHRSASDIGVSYDSLLTK